MKNLAIFGLVLTGFVLGLALPEAVCAAKPDKGKPDKGKKLSNPVIVKTAPASMRFAVYPETLPRKLQMSVWVKNDGDADAKVVHVMLRGLGKGASWKSEPGKIVGLKPGATRIGVCSLHVPKGTPMGIYPVRVTVFASNARKLTPQHVHAKYRLRTGTVHLKSNPAAMPDLQVWGVGRKQVKKLKHVPLFKTGWIKHRFSPVVKNTGKGPSAPTTLKIHTWTWLKKSLPGMKKGKHCEYFDTLKVPALQPGQKVTLTCPKLYMCVYEIPVNAIFVVDPGNDVKESNEKNNVFVSSYGYGFKKVGIFVDEHKGAPNKSRP